MSEGEVVEQLIQFTNILLVGLGVAFTMISIYVAGLNYVVSEESAFTKVFAFVFISLAFGMLIAVMLGAQSQQQGLIARLEEIAARGDITAAGRAALENARNAIGVGPVRVTIDKLVLYLVYGSSVFVYASFFYLTFFYNWRPGGAKWRRSLAP